MILHNIVSLSEALQTQHCSRQAAVCHIVCLGSLHLPQITVSLSLCLFCRQDETSSQRSDQDIKPGHKAMPSLQAMLAQIELDSLTPTAVQSPEQTPNNPIAQSETRATQVACLSAVYTRSHCHDFAKADLACALYKLQAQKATMYLSCTTALPQGSGPSLEYINSMTCLSR